MTDYICKEVPTDNGGYLEPVSELIRCKDCRYFMTGENECEAWSICTAHMKYEFATEKNGYCHLAERKDKFVPLRHEDIHFKSEEDEKAFYEALAERKEE